MPELYEKYSVRRIEEDQEPSSPDLLAPAPTGAFVLKPSKDPAAEVAMMAYAHCCEPALGKEILDWLKKVRITREPLGRQGYKNALHMEITVEEWENGERP